ncbi:helicase [Clostridiales bacterium FE2010]|nr:helicase [Clostridiales bacterium FE2010]
MPYTDLKFFTNEPERDLYGRFSSILKSYTKNFDVLVGYFRSSGFFRLYDAMKSVEKIRILVGLNVDRQTVDIIDESRKASVTIKAATEAFQDKVEAEFAEDDVTSEKEKAVHLFVEWLRSGKLEMRMYVEAPIHAKVYIMRKDPELLPDTFGSVITGSSNFSESGLKNNLEFNVELKDAADVKFALGKFEELWAKGVPISEAYIDAIQNRTWLRNNITPYELYLKTLYEYFKEEINADKENLDSLLPPGYMRLQYQIDAVLQAKKKLEAYNGVFISDVVGLGKTYICAMLANTFSRASYKLIICPPVLVEYWRSVLQEFDVARCDVESLGKLDKVIEKGTDKYQYVFVDEAHRFRNSGTDSFTDLHQICRGKKVVLISATPLNNYSTDIENQIYLFQNKHGGTINGIRNVEGFFSSLNSELHKYKKGTTEYKTVMRKNSAILRDRLLREIMIRRTRTEIAEYYKKDMEQQGLTFPKAGKPEPIVYEFDDQTNEAFVQTIEDIKGFTYARYTPLLYLKDTKKYASLLAGQHNMGGFMKGVLVKRLESSFYAFRKTLDRFIESYNRFLKMYESGEIYVGKPKNLYDMLDNGDDNTLEYLIEHGEIWKFETKEFRTEFLNNLMKDLSQLKKWKILWDQIKVDPKLEELERCLTTNAVMKGKKVIIFTESMETAEYLYSKLDELYKGRAVCYTGGSSESLKVQIEDSFNPKNRGKNNDKYDLLITTDVLSEGINLHRANVLINYDLPWNPTRIMQRVGRINRVGTEFERIYVFNFFPTAQSKRQLPLEDRILEKLQGFHDTLGEDIKYLSDDEDTGPKKLFEDLSKDLDGEEESANPELVYLSTIRQIRDDDPKLFELIKRLPRKCKAGKKSDMVTSNATITFVRKGALKTFFLNDGQSDQQLVFMDAIRYIEAEPKEKAVSIGSAYYDQLATNEKAFDRFLMEEEAVTVEKVAVGGNDAKIIRILKALKGEPRFTDDQEEKIDLLIKRWENGEIPAKISKDVYKKCSSTGDYLELYYEIIRLVPEAYLQETKSTMTQVDGEKQIILSCYLKSEK